MQVKIVEKLNKILAILTAAIIFIVLPTGTPEDLFTTVPLIAILGINGYLFLLAIVLLIILFFGKPKD
jgi:hypothetical protein